MKIDLDLTHDELFWLGKQISQIYWQNFKINNIYRDEDGNITIKLKEIVIGEHLND